MPHPSPGHYPKKTTVPPRLAASHPDASPRHPLILAVSPRRPGHLPTLRALLRRRPQVIPAGGAAAAAALAPGSIPVPPPRARNNRRQRRREPEGQGHAPTATRPDEAWPAARVPQVAHRVLRRPPQPEPHPPAEFLAHYGSLGVADRPVLGLAAHRKQPFEFPPGRAPPDAIHLDRAAARRHPPESPVERARVVHVRRPRPVHLADP